jgi:hypothetical protein
MKSSQIPNFWVSVDTEHPAEEAGKLRSLLPGSVTDSQQRGGTETFIARGAGEPVERPGLLPPNPREELRSHEAPLP